MKKIEVWAFKLYGLDFYWNRVHKTFRPLSQNTLFVKDETQVKRLMQSKFKRRLGQVREVIPVKMIIGECEC